MGKATSVRPEKARPENASTENASTENAVRMSDIHKALATVRDPEIDESVSELAFITDVQIKGNEVAIYFRLPTFWCPANFAFMMADDMRRVVSSLSWVQKCRLRLQDHFADQEISEGVSNGHSFNAIFPKDSGQDIAATRRNFDEKSFLIRQGKVLAGLRRAGVRQDSFSELKIVSFSL